MPCTDPAVNLPSIPLLLTTPFQRARLGASTQSPEAELPPALRREDSEPDWRNAYQRLREEDPAQPEEPLPVLPALAPAPRETAPEMPVTSAATATPTIERIEAIRQIAEANPTAPPVAQSWQVELPAAAAGPAWKLHVEQAQPQAPLSLKLRVPPVAQSQARQQLSDLDKRLRDAGHDVLRARVREAGNGQRFRPVDEVEP